MNKRPNFLFIVTDQQRYDSLAFLGNSHAVTPHLDSLAESGCVFDRCITASSVCMPSRASILTGLNPAQHGVWTNGCPLARSEWIPQPESFRTCTSFPWSVSHHSTIADLLSGAGYRTAAFGKLHLTPYASDKRFGHPESWEHWKASNIEAWHGPYYGFQHVELTLGHGEIRNGHYVEWLKTQAPEVFEQISRPNRSQALEFPHCVELYPSSVPKDYHPSAWVGKRASEWIEQNSRGDSPFFAWVGIPDPHHPFVPPADLAKRAEQNEVLMPEVSCHDLGDKPKAIQQWFAKKDSQDADEEFIKRIRQYTDAMISLLDETVGTLLETINRCNLVNDTIIIFTSDHGDLLGDFGGWGKECYAFRALNHVPLIIRAPEAHLPGRYRGVVSHTDLFPTIVDWAGVRPGKNISGYNINDTIKLNKRAEPALVQHFPEDPNEQNFSLYGDDWRYTLYPQSGEAEYYDHSQDFYERQNIHFQLNEQKRKAMRGELSEAMLRAVNYACGRVAPY